jgi:hypothetical protein
MGPETGFLLWLSDAACGYPVSWNQVNPIRSAKFNASTRRSGRRYAEAARFRAIFSGLARFSRVKVVG